jgi:hypothetical protein
MGMGVTLINVGTSFLTLGAHGDGIKESIVARPVSITISLKSSFADTIVSPV